MYSIIDKCNNRFSIVLSRTGDCLDYTAPRIIQPLCIIVICNLSLCLTDSCFQVYRLQVCNSFIDGICNLRNAPFEIFKISSCIPFLIRESICIRSTVSMCCTNENILRRNAFDKFSATCLRDMQANRCYLYLQSPLWFIFFKNKSPHKEIPNFAGRHYRFTHSSGNRDQLFRSDYSFCCTGFKCCAFVPPLISKINKIRMIDLIFI